MVKTGNIIIYTGWSLRLGSRVLTAVRHLIALCTSIAAIFVAIETAQVQVDARYMRHMGQYCWLCALYSYIIR